MLASSCDNITSPSMNLETEVWQRLNDRAARQLSVDFADRVLRAARQDAEPATSFISQFMLSAATAALCFLAIALYQSQATQSQDSHSLADWQQIASAADEVALAQ